MDLMARSKRVAWLTKEYDRLHADAYAEATREVDTRSDYQAHRELLRAYLAARDEAVQRSMDEIIS